MSEGWKNGYWELFKCPLCGSTKYVEVRVQRPNGMWYTTAFYQCFHCTVMFRDPVLFTKCDSSPGPIAHMRPVFNVARRSPGSDEGDGTT